MRIDIERVRADTPGVDNVVHLNNCGAGLMPRPVLEAQLAHLRLESEIGGYEAADRAAEAIDHSYDALARLLSCHREEVAVVASATAGWDMAFYGMRLGPGDRVLTAVAEYASNALAYLQLARRTGIEIAVVPNDEYGQLDVAALERMIDERVKLISVTHLPTNGGLVNPAEAIGRIARAAGIPYLLDACQSAGQLPLDVEAIGCDMLTGTGRKFLRGPRGTGFLYVRREMLERLEPPFIDIHSAAWTGLDTFEMRPDARRFESFENHVAGKIALGVAADYACNIGLDAIAERVTALADWLRQQMDELPSVTVRDLGAKKSGIISFSVDDHDPEKVRAAMAEERINIHTTSIASTRYDMMARGLQRMNRLGVHYYNTQEELERFLTALQHLTR